MMGATRRLRRWWQIKPEDKPKIYANIYASATLTDGHYWLEILFAAGIATCGLILNSPAVIIGAMLISPLMGPIMATGLGLAAGDLYLTGKAVIKLLWSVTVAMCLSAMLVWLVPFHSPTAEILARTNPNLLDLAIALLSGLSGSVALSRSMDSEAMTTVPGVAIAVALMPPLCTMGFGVGSGMRREIVSGAGLLFLTNIVAIVFSAFVVFLSTGMTAKALSAEMRTRRSEEPFAQALTHGRFGASMLDGGRLRWRILILIAMLGAVAWPLQRALRQLASEARTRETVQQLMNGLVPRSERVSEQTEVGKQSVAVRVITTGAVNEAKVHVAETEIQRRTGKTASIAVASVASQSELARLMERVNSRPIETPAPPPAPSASLEVRGDAMMKRVDAVLMETWPAEVPVVDDALDFTRGVTTLTVHYRSARALDSVAAGLLQSALREKLATPGLVLEAKRVGPLTREDRAKLAAK